MGRHGISRKRENAEALQGRTDEARKVLDASVLDAARASLGPTVDTMMLEAIEARLSRAEGGGLLSRMRTSLGPQSPETQRCERALADEESA